MEKSVLNTDNKGKESKNLVNGENTPAFQALTNLFILYDNHFYDACGDFVNEPSKRQVRLSKLLVFCNVYSRLKHRKVT